MNRKSSIVTLYCIILIHWSVFPLVADDPEPSEKIMEIISKTKNYSAKIARNKNATETEKEKDLTRKKIGIGEQVTITLTSKKPALLEPKDQIQWKVTKGEELLLGGLTSNKDKPESASFWVSPFASKKQIEGSGGLVIEVSTQQETALPEPIRFEVIFPEQLTAEHDKTWSEGGVAMPEYPQDESDIPGVSAMLHVSVHPLDVCYAGIRIIEKDEGYEGPAGSLAGPHEADSIWNIDTENRFGAYDNIGASFSRRKLNETQGVDEKGNPIYKHQYPNEWTWDCLFRTCNYSDTEGISDITHVYQRFHINREPQDQFYMRIKKFLVEPTKIDECSVERTTGGKHIFKP